MSICLYDAFAEDWDNIGLCTLIPTECEVEEKAGGMYELRMVHPMTADMRWAALQRGCIIKAPVPQVQTPAINIYHEGTPEVPAVPGRIIWRVNATTSGSNGSSRIYSKATTDKNKGSRILARLPNGTEYEYLGAVGSNWHRAVSKEGVTGYMYTQNSVYVRTEVEQAYIPGTPGYSSVVKPRQVRDQLFRIYYVTRDSEKGTVTVEARHISYDLVGNIGRYSCKKTPVVTAVQALFDSFINDNDFTVFSNITKKISGDWQTRNGIEALLDPDEGIVPKMRAEFYRDNFDLFVLKAKARDRGVWISFGKNLMGVTSSENDANVITRIMPVGEDKDGKRLYLPEKYVDSAYIKHYPVIRAKTLEVSDAKVSDDMTKEQAYAAMREAAKEEFDNGCDMAELSMEISFIHLGDTAEYAAYHDLQQVFIYDTVTIRHAQLGLYARAQVNGYVWDCILKRYKSVSIGDVFEVAGGGIAGYQLPTGGVSGTKLVPGSVGSGQLRDLSVTNAKIENAAITSAKIGTAQIGTAHIQDASIDEAKIREAAIDTAHIKDLSVTGAKIGAAQIDTAKIADAAITTAKIAEASIENAHIVDATITVAKIKDLTAEIIKATVAEIREVTAGTVQTNELYGQIIMAVCAELKKVKAETVETNELSAQIINAVCAELDRVVISDLKTHILSAVAADIENLSAGQVYAAVINAVAADVDLLAAGRLYTALAEVSRASVSDLDVDFANIKDMQVGNAIITRGEGDKLHINQLAVTDANMVSLTTGELILKGEDGRFYALQVTEDGEVVSVPSDVTNAIADGSLPGSKIIERSITAAELNVGEIFADSALVGAITAGNLDVDSLFADKAFIGALKTHLIQSDYLSVVINQAGGVFENLSTFFDFTQDALVIRKTGSKFFVRISNTELGFYDNGERVAYVSNGQMYIPKATITDVLTTGRHAWITESNGSMSLLYE